MGYADGQVIPWQRWLFPIDAEIPISDDGFLEDPEANSDQFMVEAVHLSALEDHRVILLFGESGVGKSSILRAEESRRRSQGEPTALITLSGLDQQEIREEIDDAFSQTTGPVVVLVDGFDQAQSHEFVLSRVVRKGLESKGARVRQLIMATRRALWDEAVESALPGWAPTPSRYLVAPLTRQQAEQAAETDAQDPHSLIDHVVSIGAGPIAAQPMSLKLLLQAASRGKMPKDRTDAYGLGVEGLLEEPNSAHRMGPPLDARVRAAQRLATASLLSGLGRVRPRRRAGQNNDAVALEQVVNPAVALDVLEAVYRSAVFAGDGDTRTWAHRSVEEYLCARLLHDLPKASAGRLLEPTSSPGTLRPTFAGVAAWLATWSDEWFEWLLDRRYEALFNPDLELRSRDQRRRLSAKLAAHITSDDLPYVPGTEPGLRSSVDYRGLGDDGIEDDFSELLTAEQQWWRTREALLVVIANRIRRFDGQLVAILTALGDNFGPGDFGPDVQVAIYAATALRGCVDPSLVEIAKALVGNKSAPWMVRLEIARWLCPQHMSIADVVRAVPFAEWRLGANMFGGALIDLLVRAAGRSDDERSGLVRLINESPESVLQMRGVIASAYRLTRDIVAESEPQGELWSQAAELMSRCVEEYPHGRQIAFVGFGNIDSERRRGFALAVLAKSRGPIGARVHRMIELDLIQAEDITWWRNASAASTHILPAESSTAVVEQLAALPRSDAARDLLHPELANADRGVQPAMRPVLDLAFGSNTAVRRLRVDISGAEEPSIERNAPGLPANQLSAALELDEPAAILDYLWDLHEPEADRTAYAEVSTQISSHLAHAAAVYLQTSNVDGGVARDQDRLVVAHTILKSIQPAVIDSVPADRWVGWLPHLLTGPGLYGLARTALRIGVRADRERTDKVVISVLDDPTVVPQIRGFESVAICAAALELARQDDVNAYYLRNLLELAQVHLPDKAGQLAIEYIRRRPIDHNQQEDVPEFRRAVYAAAALAEMSSLPNHFGELLDEFRRDMTFARAVLHAGRAGGGNWWKALMPDELGSLYMWAHEVFERTWLTPGVAVSGIWMDALPDDILGMLGSLDGCESTSERMERGNHAARVLDSIARETNNAFARQMAGQLRDFVFNDDAFNSLDAIMASLDNSYLHAVKTNAQLAGAVLEALDDLAQELATDRALRAQLWHRQRDQNQWGGYVPLEETELSDWLSRDLRGRLHRKVALVREVEIQPRLGEDGKDIPDLLAVALTAGPNRAEVIIEVKCNWNDKLTSGLEDQLGHRYLRGPHGRVGLYVVGFFRGESWVATDGRRRRAARNIAHVQEELNAAAQRLHRQGVSVDIRVLDLVLDEG